MFVGFRLAADRPGLLHPAVVFLLASVFGLTLYPSRAVALNGMTGFCGGLVFSLSGPAVSVAGAGFVVVDVRRGLLFAGLAATYSSVP